MATESGWHDGAEVVTVRFDPNTISYRQLLEQALERECATAGAWTTTDAQWELARQSLGDRARRLKGTPRPDKEPKYRLFKSPWRAIPMTELQAVRINARLARGEAFDELLSPRQRQIAAVIRLDPKAEWPNLVGVELDAAWSRIEAFANEQRDREASPARRDR